MARRKAMRSRENNEIVSAGNDTFVRDCCEEERAFRQTYNNAITSGFEIKRERVTEKKEPFARCATRIRGLTETG